MTGLHEEGWVSGRVETTKREPESLPRLFLPKKFSPLSQTFSRDSVLQEPITLRLGTDSQSQRKSAAPRKSLTKIRNLQGESASTSEHFRTFTAQMRSLSPEQGWQLSRPHSYLEAEQAWSWDWHSAPAPLSSSPNCPQPWIKREQRRKPRAQQDDTTNRRQINNVWSILIGPLSPRVRKLKIQFLQPTLIIFNTFSKFLRN